MLRAVHGVLWTGLVWGLCLQWLLGSVSFSLATLFFSVLTMTVPIAIFWKTLAPLVGQLLQVVRPPRLFGSIIIGIALYPGMQLLGYFLTGFLYNPVETHLKDFDILVGLAVIVVAPFMEEFFFRGLLIRVYRQAGIAYSIFWVSLSFGLYHLNVFQALYTFALSMVLCLMILNGKSFWETFIVHAVLNALVFIRPMFQAYVGPGFVAKLMAPQAWSIGMQLLYLAGLGVGIWQLVINADQNKVTKGLNPLSEPLYRIFIASSIFLMVLQN